VDLDRTIRPSRGGLVQFSDPGAQPFSIATEAVEFDLSAGRSLAHFPDRRGDDGIMILQMIENVLK
jgi:hypothetical protein